jgi:hypothetical protein
MSAHTFLSTAAVLVLATSVAGADTFSIDQDSPTVVGFLFWPQQADDLLVLPPETVIEVPEDCGGSGPWVGVPGPLFPRHLVGFAPTLDIDAISSNHLGFELSGPHGYRIVFSVRRDSDGDPGTAVNDQALLGQQAGDLFESRMLFWPVLPDDAEDDGGPTGNDLRVNQDELLEVPCIPADVFCPGAIDELSAFDFAEFDADGDGAFDRRIYYSVSLESDPDFAMYIFTLPAGWNIADVPAEPWGLAPVYTDRFQLGLTSADDIDALVVFDADDDGEFTAGDAIVLSLRQGSTSLNPGMLYHDGEDDAFLAAGNPGSYNDAFYVYMDAAGMPHLGRLATRQDLGWNGPAGDGDVDALEVIIEPVDSELCPGDLDGDGDVDLADLATLLGHYGMTGSPSYEDGDLDGDGDVDLADLAALLSVYGTTCP